MGFRVWLWFWGIEACRLGLNLASALFREYFLKSFSDVGTIDAAGFVVDSLWAFSRRAVGMVMVMICRASATAGGCCSNAGGDGRGCYVPL